MSVEAETKEAEGLALSAAFAPALGRLLLGLGAAGLGLLSLIHADFALNWQPVPADLAARPLLARLSGLLLLAVGAGLIGGRARRLAAAGLAIFLLSWVLLLHPFRLAAGVEAAWLATAEALAVAAGAGMIAGLRPRLGRIAFGLCLPVFGLAHFLYIGFTASMTPAWIPEPVFWAWFTGAAHVAAGLSLVSGVLTRLAASLLATMFSLFVVLVHIPRVAAHPEVRLEWHLLSTAMLLTGAAWTVAGQVLRKGRPPLKRAGAD